MSVTIDEVDRGIIAALQRNPAETNTAIAAQVGMSDVGVSNRIRRLIDNNVIRTTVLYDTDALGLRFYVVIELLVRGRPLAAVAEDLAKIPDLQTVVTLIGSPDISVLFFARDHAHVEEVRARIAPIAGVHSMQVMISTRLAKYMTTHGGYAILSHDED